MKDCSLCSMITFMCKVICVTDLKLCENKDEQLRRLVNSGIDMLILRAKELSEDEYRALAKEVTELAEQTGTEVVLHSFYKTAIELGAKKIHLPLPVLRELDEDTKSRFEVIGASVHSVDEAREAVSLGASYLTAGHIFETDCKKGLKGRGTAFLREVCESVDVPVYAIGGISPDNVWRVKRAGADGVCLMSAFMTDSQPDLLAGRLKDKLSARITAEQLRLYAITDNRYFRDRGMVECVEAALKGGANIIQLRDKGVSHEQLVQEAKLLREICVRYDVPLIVNDDWRAALEAGADGVHVGIEDESVAEIRRHVPEGFIIGATAKTVEQAQTAQAQGADYLGVGAMFASPTKPNAIHIDKAQFTRIKQSVRIPCVAIGGITKANLPTLSDIGPDGFALVSAVFGAEDIETETKELAALCRCCWGKPF